MNGRESTPDHMNVGPRTAVHRKLLSLFMKSERSFRWTAVRGPTFIWSGVLSLPFIRVRKRFQESLVDLWVVERHACEQIHVSGKYVGRLRRDSGPGNKLRNKRN